jgi:hypothetical protein
MVRSVEMIRLRVQITEYAADNCQPIFATMARIALNARLLIAGKLEGIGWFTHECYQRMIAAHPEHQFQLFFDRTPSKEFCYGENASEVRLLPPARRHFLYDAWFDYAVTRQLNRWEADVFFRRMACSAGEQKCRRFRFSRLELHASSRMDAGSGSRSITAAVSLNSHKEPPYLDGFGLFSSGYCRSIQVSTETDSRCIECPAHEYRALDF